MNSELEELKSQFTAQYLQGRGVDVDEASRNNTVCPVCGNGKKTGCFHYFPDSFKVKCFSCGFAGDLFDLIAQEKGIDNAAAIREAKAMYAGAGDKKPRKATFSPPNSDKEEMTDYSPFLLQAEQRNDFQYLQGRGISAETQKYFHVGFCPDWKSPKGIKTTLENGGNPDNLPTSPRCIIPRNKYNYLARDTRQNLTQEQSKFDKQNTGRTSLFNIAALEAAAVFIVEGEIDAMSIYEVGGAACGLCSVANRGILLNHLKEHRKPGQAFIIMLDNDEAGKKGTAELEKGLQGLGLPYICAEYPDGIKDPNEYLQADRAGLEAAISLLQAQALEAAEAARGNEYNAADLLEYFKNIETQPKGIEAKTGFNELDSNLSGGLHEGLYIIGAISSLGKTTFSLQIADQIAESGQDVIFFSLEMSKYELIAKSISRHTYEIAREAKTKDGKRPLARDTQQILNNRRYSAYDTDEKEVIRKAIAGYERQAQHLFIYEGRYKGERLTVSHIRGIVEAHMKETGKAPVVFVDYLQIIAPADSHASDKQNTDIAVFELKEISRDFKIPVFAISSFNRENYLEPVSMTSFKESGAVEYSSDVLFGLQYMGMDYQDGDSDKKRKERLRDLMNEVQRKKRTREPIEIELKCLKHRNGYNFSLGFYMIPAYNHFESILGKAGLEEWQKAQENKKKTRI